MKMAKKIEKILEKNYIKKIFKKRIDFYFPQLKSKKISDIEIERISPVWTKKTCLARYEIIFFDSSKKIIRASANIDNSKKRTFKIMKYLYENGFNKGKFQVPKPLDYIDEVGALFYKEADGLPLALLMEKYETPPLVFEDLAQFLFKLHSFDSEIKERAIIFNLGHYRKIFKKIKKFFPKISPYIIPENKISFVDKLNKSLGFLHGDFYPGNILIDQKGEITIIDFDRSGVGPSFLDIASLSASLDFPKSVWPISVSKKLKLDWKEEFLRKYCQLSDFDFEKITRQLNKFLIKIYLDQVYFLSAFIFEGWNEIDLKTKNEFSKKIKDLFLKIKKYL
jgi:thiamine kinase-like enzyme